MDGSLSLSLCVCEWERGIGKIGGRRVTAYAAQLCKRQQQQQQLQKTTTRGRAAFYRSPFVFAVVIEGLMRQKNKAKA